MQRWLKDINWNNKRYDYSGKGVKIAVIDTGVDSNHSDFKDTKINVHRVIHGKDLKNYTHGTRVTSIICSYPNCRNGVLGMAPDAEITMIDVLDDNGNVQTNDLIRAINYAIRDNVDIINISFGVEEHSEKLHIAIRKAYDKGITIVAAAGNELNGNVLYPARFDETICVAAESNDGKNLHSLKGCNNYITVPGENIITAYSNKEYTNIYSIYSGSSMASPIVTGTVALIIEKNENVPNDKITNYFNRYQGNFDVKNILRDF